MIKDNILLEKVIDTKCSYADMVTEVDCMVEKFVFSSIREKYPNHSFIGEESVTEGVSLVLTDNPTWIVDPIDGTSNFIHGIQNVCISIGLMCEQEVVMGVIYNPITDVLYSARKGEGAFCNGSRIHVSSCTDLKKAVVISEFGNSRDSSLIESKLSSMRKILYSSHGIRSYGSAALNMCFVAEGSHDAYYEIGMHIWDIAAATIIVREAGGVVLDIEGGDVDFLSRRVLCSSCEAVARALVPLIGPLDIPRD